MVYERLRPIVADAADVALDAVGPDTDMFEELGLDSLGFVMIFVDLEDAFKDKLKIAEPENMREIAPTLRTPRAIVEYALEQQEA